MTVTSEGLAAFAQEIVARHTRELLETPEAELSRRWRFSWDEKASIEWNIYKFSDALEMFKRDCRQWETHHNGYLCVVERVRDKYLMPRIKEFKATLASKLLTEQSPLDS